MGQVIYCAVCKCAVKQGMKAVALHVHHQSAPVNGLNATGSSSSRLLSTNQIYEQDVWIDVAKRKK